jgi:ATP-dependent Clp protease protease subunit
MVPIVIESTKDGERSYDIFSRMLKDRIIFINGQVDEHMSRVVTAQLLFLEAQDPRKDIYMYINSPGGSVVDGLAIYDTMQYIKPDVVTLCMGQACSMGSVFLMGGAANKRYILPNARVMIHQVSAGVRGQATDMQIHLEEILKMKKQLTELYVKHTGHKYKKCYDAMERDNFMSPEEALKFKLVDHIVEQVDDIK